MPQIKALAAGLDIVVATPGRLLDHLRAGKARLDKTTTIVLDEADQMLDLALCPPFKRFFVRRSKSASPAVIRHHAAAHSRTRPGIYESAA